jgi:hypothetical protein
MPDPWIVLAFLGGAIFNAVLNAITGEVRARSDQSRKKQLDRDERGRLAAIAILDDIDRCVDAYSRPTPPHGQQQEVEPHYRAIRRRTIEIADKEVRAIIEEIADAYYYDLGARLLTGENPSSLWYADASRDAAREVLGAFLRGEPVVEPPYLRSHLRPLVTRVRESYEVKHDTEPDTA